MSDLEAFFTQIRAGGLAELRKGQIGRNVPIDAGFGPQPLLYADYVASGRALVQVEDFVRERVLPFYANSHTEASWCGSAMTQMREQARAAIVHCVGGDESCKAVFTGAGATAGINMLVSLLDIRQTLESGARVVVLVGPYEHHSNILPWRESGAEVVQIAEDPARGGPDLAVLEDALLDARSAALVIGAFSACSNVTGIITDTDAVTRLLKQYGALAIWDYAGGGPYLPIRMSPDPECRKDAIILSAHKFPGGPGASGVTVLRESVIRNLRPHRPGGGTVSFVSPWSHSYSSSVTAREEGGTPNVVGDIRAALVMLAKEAIGTDLILHHAETLRQRALKAWQGVAGLHLLGPTSGVRALPILSFRVTDRSGGAVHHQLFVRMLSDVYGIQARGGCACAGPYGHQLLQISKEQSARIEQNLDAGAELAKPGWVRLNLSCMHDETDINRILSSVPDLIGRADRLADQFDVDPATARFFSKRADPRRRGAAPMKPAALGLAQKTA